MKDECQNPKKQGDCITRNAKTLCDFCDSLLSDDERTHREIALFVADCKRKAEKKAERCLTLRKSGTDPRTCREKKLTALCSYCCAQMTDRQLVAWATKIINRQNESRDYWEERAEQDEYIAELKEAGVIGVDWNIEQCDADGYTDRTATIFFLFTFGKPCFIHSHEGWIKHGYSKKTSLNQSAASHR